jgi:hypothetical protein
MECAATYLELGVDEAEEERVGIGRGEHLGGPHEPCGSRHTCRGASGISVVPVVISP